MSLLIWLLLFKEMPIQIDDQELRKWCIMMEAGDFCEQIVNAAIYAIKDNLVVPRDTGTMEAAFESITLAARVGNDWEGGIGDMDKIGVGPFDDAPRGTISEFLRMFGHDDE